VTSEGPPPIPREPVWAFARALSTSLLRSDTEDYVGFKYSSFNMHCIDGRETYTALMKKRSQRVSHLAVCMGEEKEKRTILSVASVDMSFDTVARTAQRSARTSDQTVNKVIPTKCA
jgi:hypothetical protein